MKIEEFIEVLEAIRDKRPFKLDYRLLREGRLNRFVDVDMKELIDFMNDIMTAEPADFD